MDPDKAVVKFSESEEEYRSPAWLPFLLQCSDSAFPSGSYTHSYGLEEMVSLGRVYNPSSLKRFLLGDIMLQLRNQELPYLAYAYRFFRNNSEGEITLLDREITASKLSDEIRKASLSQGKHRLDLLEALFPENRWVQFMQLGIAENTLEGNQTTVLAMQYVIQRIPIGAALYAHGYQMLANYVTASMKLLRIGQTACQKILLALREPLQVATEDAQLVKRGSIGAFSPLLDIASSRHATAFTRLFIS